MREATSVFRSNVQIISELTSFSQERETLLTIGVYDGVHLGHQQLIKKLTQQAAIRNLVSGVVTFSRHPKVVLSHQARLPRLTTLEEKTRLLNSFGVELVVPLTFGTDLAALSAREFVGLLQEHLQMRGLVIGPNFALGRKREGNVEALRILGDELGFTVEVVDPLMVGASMTSSTAIREALSLGDMGMTSKLLGRYFSLSGLVVRGMERGHILGFPTANLDVDTEQALPTDGVYATLCHIGDEVHQSVTNIGTRPTFGEGERSVEAHLMDFTGDIYGQKLTIEIVERLRGEVKFADLKELAAQINRDIERTREMLK